MPRTSGPGARATWAPERTSTKATVRRNSTHQCTRAQGTPACGSEGDGGAPETEGYSMSRVFSRNGNWWIDFKDSQRIRRRKKIGPSKRVAHEVLNGYLGKVARLLVACESAPLLKAFVLIALNTGMRLSEILGL